MNSTTLKLVENRPNFPTSLIAGRMSTWTPWLLKRTFWDQRIRYTCEMLNWWMQVQDWQFFKNLIHLQIVKFPFLIPSALARPSHLFLGGGGNAKNQQLMNLISSLTFETNLESVCGYFVCVCAGKNWITLCVDFVCGVICACFSYLVLVSVPRQ